jgi:hypothetical protein
MPHRPAVELLEGAVLDRGALPAEVADGNPRRRVAPLHGPHVVRAGVLGEAPFQPVQVAARLDHGAGALGGGLRERACAHPAERRVEVRRRRGDEQELAVPALDEAGLHGLEQLAARKPKDGSVRNALDALARDGEVVKNADGLWCKVHGPLRMN